MRVRLLLQLAVSTAMLSACGSGSNEGESTTPKTQTFVLGATSPATDTLGAEQAIEPRQDDNANSSTDGHSGDTASPSDDVDLPDQVSENDTIPVESQQNNDDPASDVSDTSNTSDTSDSDTYPEDTTNDAPQKQSDDDTEITSPAAPEPPAKPSDIARIDSLLKDGEPIPTTQARQIIREDGPAGQLISRIERVASMPILELNQKLSGGEELSSREKRCLYDYDPAEGKPLLGFKCSVKHNIDRAGILAVQEAAFLNTESCRGSLLSASVDTCSLFAAKLSLRSHTNQLISSTVNTPSSSIDRPEPTLPPRPEPGEVVERPEPVSLSERPERPDPPPLPEKPSEPASDDTDSSGSNSGEPNSSTHNIVNGDSSADATQASPSNPTTQRHAGADISFRVDGTDMRVTFVNGSKPVKTNCSLNITNNELSVGDSEICEDEYKRLTERFDYIIGVVTAE